MSYNIEVTIEGTGRTFKGRLIGLINEEECRAISNTSDAARKIYSTSTLPFEDLDMSMMDKRIVIATSERTAENKREVFISPVVRWMYYLHPYRVATCKDGNKYKLRGI